MLWILTKLKYLTRVIITCCWFQRSVDLETKLSSRNFSQKTNEPICFSILMTRKYLKLEIKMQVSSIFDSSGWKTNSFIRFLGEVTARQFCFETYWPLILQVSLRQWNDFRFVHKCGAVLLTRDWIITAAHCVKDISHHNLQVRIGEYNFMDENEPHSHIDRRISKVVTHANFDTVKL